jgi:hypothetical protein
MMLFQEVCLSGKERMLQRYIADYSFAKVVQTDTGVRRILPCQM